MSCQRTARSYVLSCQLCLTKGVVSRRVIILAPRIERCRSKARLAALQPMGLKPTAKSS